MFHPIQTITRSLYINRKVDDNSYDPLDFSLHYSNHLDLITTQSSQLLRRADRICGHLSNLSAIELRLELEGTGLVPFMDDSNVWIMREMTSVVQVREAEEKVANANQTSKTTGCPACKIDFPGLLQPVKVLILIASTDLIIKIYHPGTGIPPEDGIVIFLRA